MTASHDDQPSYLHGAEVSEQTRLEAQAKLLGGAEFLPALRPGMRILEVGCGTGAIAREVAGRVAPGEVVGVDREERQLGTARRLATDQGVKNMQFRSGEASKLDFPGGEFDAAYCRFVLEHVADPLAVVREMKRVVKSSGWVCAYEWANECDVCYPGSPAVREAWMAIYRFQEAHGGDPWIARKLYGIFLQVGLDDVKAEGSAWTVTAGEQENLRLFVEGAREITRQTRDGLLSEHFVSEELLAQAEQEYRQLLDCPHTFIVAGFCRAIGTKPL